MAQVEATFQVPFPMENTTFVSVLPKDASSDRDPSRCANDTQSLILKWTDFAPNDTSVTLDRNVTLQFSLLDPQVSSEPGYGIFRIFSYMEVAKFNQTDTDTNSSSIITSWITFDTEYRYGGEGLLFPVPVGRSMSCSNPDDISLFASLHYSFPDEPSEGKKLPNGTLTMTHLLLDAFRGADAPLARFQVRFREFGHDFEEI